MDPTRDGPSRRPRRRPGPAPDPADRSTRADRRGRSCDRATGSWTPGEFGRGRSLLPAGHRVRRPGDHRRRAPRAGQRLYRLDDEDEALADLGARSSSCRRRRRTYGPGARSPPPASATGTCTGAIAAYREADRRAPAEDKAEIASRLGWLAKETGDSAGRAPLLRPRPRATCLPIATYVDHRGHRRSSRSRPATRAPTGVDTLRALWLDKAGVADGEYWRLFTVTLVHGADRSILVHLGFNMYALYLVGPIVEQLYGSRGSSCSCTSLAAIGGSLGELRLRRRRTLGTGASGAIFGLFGVLFAATRLHLPVLDRREPGHRRPDRHADRHQHRLRLRVNGIGQHRQRGPHRRPARPACWLGFVLAARQGPDDARRCGSPADGTTGRPAARPRSRPLGARRRSRSPRSAGDRRRDASIGAARSRSSTGDDRRRRADGRGPPGVGPARSGAGRISRRAARRDRQDHADPRAVRGDVLRDGVAAVGPRQLAHDRQAEPGARPATGRVAPVEPLEARSAAAGREAGPVVGDATARSPAGPPAGPTGATGRASSQT